MSRIGKKLIALPKDVTVKIDGQRIVVKGKKGELSRSIHSSMRVVQKDASLSIEVKDPAESVSNFFGLSRSLVNNMVLGVSTGFVKKLMLKGVGYRAQVKGHELHLGLGFSHPIVYDIPKGISISLDKDVKEPVLIIEGCDKELVGQTAAEIRGFRKPEPYHGKGVRYLDEVIVTKVGKSAKK